MPICTVTKTVTEKIDLSFEEAAEWFCGLNDDEQAKFFVACAKKAIETWTEPTYMQWHAVGSHLATCKCSTEEAREMILCIASSIEKPSHAHP